jgi:hypothetical protein
MANWSNPTLTSLYTDFLAELKARDEDLAKQFDGQTVSNLITGAIRWSSSANRWQKWSGSAWAELTTTYALTGLSTTGNASIGGTLAVTGTTALAAATATTPATNDNSTAVATTAYVRAQAYAGLASPAFTGTPTAPTAALNTNTTQIATTAFVISQGADSTPLMAGTAEVGTSLEFARGDHVHPTDTSRAPLASPTFTGTPAAPTAAVSTNTTQLATTAFVLAQISNDAPLKNGTGATGTWSISISGNAATATKLATARTINGVPFDGSADITITSGALTNPLTAGTYLTSTGTYDGSVARTFAVDATSANTVSKVVARDGSGNFSAGTITASLTGTASGNLALTGGTLSGALIGAAGTVSAPGIAVGEAGTGLFRPATGVLAFASAGGEALRITAADGLALGSTGTNANVGFRHAKSITGGTTAWGNLTDGAVQADVTTSAVGYQSGIGTAASVTLASLIHFQAGTGTLGASTAITNQYGFVASSSIDGATNDYGFFGNIASGTGNWNCYMGGTAPNFFNGQVQLGAGSVGTPSLAFNSDTNTGLYSADADLLGIVTGGALAGAFDTNGNLRLYNSAGTFYHDFSGQPTANRTITLPDASVTLVSGTMVPTTGTGATGTWGISVTGNAGTATALATARTINGVAFDGTANITIATASASSITFNNGGAGGASGSTYNGGTALTVSYNTIGAPSTTGANASGTWGISVTGSAGSATNASNVALTAGTAATNYVLFAEAATGNQAAKTDAGLVYNASTNVLATSISGNAATSSSCSGNAATATTASACSGNAASATLVSTIQDATGTGTFYIPMVNSNAAGNRQLRINTAGFGTLAFNAATSTILGNISGDSGSCIGNSATATKLSSSRTFQLTGDLSGSVNADLSTGFTISAQVSDNSHNHDTSTLTNVTSGTYTPTLTNTANISASNVGSGNFQYQRVGNIVSICGTVSLTPSSSTANFELRITLPIAPATFANTTQAHGVAGDDGNTINGRVVSVGSTTVVAFIGRSTTTGTSRSCGLSFSYRI